MHDCIKYIAIRIRSNIRSNIRYRYIAIMIISDVIEVLSNTMLKSSMHSFPFAKKEEFLEYVYWFKYMKLALIFPKKDINDFSYYVVLRKG